MKTRAEQAITRVIEGTDPKALINVLAETGLHEESFRRWSESELDKLPVGSRLHCKEKWIVGGKDTIIKLDDGSWKDDTNKQPQNYSAKQVARLAHDYEFALAK